MSTTVSIQLYGNIAHELDGLARTMERSRTYIIRNAIESYHKEYAGYSVAIERLNNKDAEIISSDKVRNCLAL